MINRIFKLQLREMLEVFPVVALVGSRQVGKSTLVQDPEVGQGRRYMTLDDMTARKLAESDPETLIADDSPLTIDEVQLAPELLRTVKQCVDRDRIPGRFLLTGSADLNHLADLSHILAGRVGIMQLPPITHFEERGGQGKPSWLRILDGDDHPATTVPPFGWQRLVRGGFPSSLTETDDRKRSLWLESFRQTYLERDLRRISDIGHLTDFARLMQLSASRTAQILNQAALSRDAGLNAATAGRYLSLLEASFLIHRLHPWFSNIGKRLVKAPKLYWADTALACSLCGLAAQDFPGHPMTGPLFETFVMMEIKALLSYFHPEARLHYLRSHDGLEIDGLIQRGEHLYPLEIKATRTVTPDDARPILRWRELSGSAAPGLVLYPGTEIKTLARKVTAVPIQG